MHERVILPHKVELILYYQFSESCISKLRPINGSPSWKRLDPRSVRTNIFDDLLGFLASHSMTSRLHFENTAVSSSKLTARQRVHSLI